MTQLSPIKTMNFAYSMKSIPTTYSGVVFRARHEARWAAFFDLAGISWDYEPFDLDGWAPDFLLRTKLAVVLAEVKPFDLTSVIQEGIDGGEAQFLIPIYDKAMNYQRRHQVILLGASPILTTVQMPIGFPLDPPIGATYDANALYDQFYVDDDQRLWREAGSLVQWRPANRNFNRVRQAA